MQDQQNVGSALISKPFDPLIMFLKEFLEKVNFEKSQQTSKKHEKLLSMQWVKAARWQIMIFSLNQKYVHELVELLVNRLFKLAQEKVWLGELTVPPWP